jgi:hypothetical protein
VVVLPVDRLRSRRAAGAIGVIGVAALAIGIVVGAGLPGSSQGASPAAKVSGATTVERRNLVATDTESGTLSYANPQTVYNRMSGTVTWLPAVGQLIKPGHALYYVDNQPVVLFGGTTPAYRDLTSGITNGPDVTELNRDLVSMGFDPSHEITVNNTWQTGTTDAISRWQASLGETQTGTITLGQAVFLPGAQRVTTVDSVLGSTGGSSSATGSGSSSATSTTSTSRAQFVDLTTTKTASAGPKTTNAANCPTTKHKSTTPKPKSQCNPSTEAALLALLKAETLALQKQLASSSHSAGSSSAGGSSAGGARGGGGSSGAAGGASAGGSGGSAGAGGSSGSTGSGGGATAQPILQTTSNQLNVVVDLDATKQSEAVVGEPLTVQMPNGSVVNGKITQVSPIAQSSSSSSSSGSGSGSGASGSSSGSPSATIPVTIALQGSVPAYGLDQAAVSVNFQQQVQNNVLSVPVTALLATAGGGYAVQEAAAPHRLIAVTPGLFAAGYVQISGSQIYPGLQVTDSQG